MTDLFDTASRAAEAERFLNLIFGNLRGDRYSYLWTKQDKATYPYRVTDATQRKAMAQRAIELSDSGKDVYVGVNVGDEPAAPDKRYTKEQITVQTATVTDIDVEGSNHISDAAQIYPPNGAVAKSFLPFAASLVVDSGYGLHGYCLFDEPLAVADENRDACIARNKRFIEAVRARAGVFSKAVDGVGDLPRVLRCPGTFNYKSKNTTPICRLVEVNDIRFTPADLDARLAALEPPAVSKQHAEPKAASTPKRQYQPASDEPSEQDRARAMLAFIPCAEQTYEDWIAVGMCLKNNGNDVSDWTHWSRDDSRFKDGETESKWQGFSGGGLTIATLHRLAQFYGYDEKSFRSEWYNLRGIKPARRPKDDEPARADSGDSGRDALIDSLFAGDGSDRAFAKRLEAFCGDRVKWCNEENRWYTYSGGVWTAGGGENSAIANFADELAETMQQHASNDDEHKLAAKFQSSKKIGCAIGLLKARHSVRITLDDLDHHGELLNCRNCVVNLETGDWLDADPSLLLTKQAGAAFDPKASSPLVEEFFKAIQPDEETRAGLLRWLAYCLTSETREHKFAVWTGRSGANGKSTLSGVMLKLLGTYGTGLNPRALLKTARPADADRATTSLNPLENRRAAFIDELPLNAELDSALVKNLSGGGDINLRFNYSEYRTVANYAKINISGNFMPRIENTADGGLERRLLNFAFNVRFGTAEHPADPQLKDKLILPENLRGLLALLVREAVAWYRGGGLIISSAMKAETQRILDESNFVADFLADGDFYVKAPNAEVKAKEFIEVLRDKYPKECSQFNKRADLIRLIAAQDGVAYGKGNHNVNVFKGIGKAARDEFDGEPVDPKDTPF